MKFPPAKWFGTRRPDFVERRRQELQVMFVLSLYHVFDISRRKLGRPAESNDVIGLSLGHSYMYSTYLPTSIIHNVTPVHTARPELAISLLRTPI